MSTKIVSSSELMTNYMQGEIVSPAKKFISLQSEEGHSLLFSIGTDDKFYLTEERTTQETGWQRSDLSSELTSHFPEGSTIRAKTFAVDQSSIDNRFSAILAVTVADLDYLFVASKYDRDENGNLSLEWTELPFDRDGQTDQSIKISEIYIMQTATSPLIIVDTIPLGKTTLERYYIDSRKEVSNTFWNLYTLPINMDPDSASICGGRKNNEQVNGIYSLGKIGQTPSLFYQQIYNPYNPSAPGATGQLNVPSATPQAIASTVSAKQSGESNIYTDLYVSTVEGDLFLFESDNQQNKAEGLKIMNHDLFQSVVNLYALTIDNQIVVWGLNRSQQIFYTECDRDRTTDPSAWSYPGTYRY